MSSEEHLLHSPRFAIRRRLGSGGMGVVYHAYDRELGRDVALKTLRIFDAQLLYRLKREFRSLVGVSHPNLVSLYELVSEGETWCFTMELVRGVSLAEHLTPGFAPFPGGSSAVSSLSGVGRALGPVPAAVMDEVSTVDAVERPRPDFAKLGPALGQLAAGLHELHAHGKLHRDVKPSNVLVTPADRLVLLDFGLVTSLFPSRHSVTEQHLAGTVPYMSPETMTDPRLGPPTDWYSLGVLLYELLAGRLPFVGTGLEIMLAKAERPPRPPSTWHSDVPAELERLCLELLAIDPAERPKGPEVLARLGVSPRRPARTSDSSPRRAPFLGRIRQLGELEAAVAATRPGSPRIVLVRGPAGVGKTALVRQLLDALAERDEALIVAGRSYEREQVPFKAVDTLVDVLTRLLARQGDEFFSTPEAAPIPGLVELARLFPVLRRLTPIKRLVEREALARDGGELIGRAAAAFAGLLRRLADGRPVVLFVDDLHFSDRDSVVFLEHALAEPGVRIAFLGAHRTEEEDDGSALARLSGARIGDAAVRRLNLEPLAEAEALDLALTLLGPDAPGRAERARRIAAESKGLPFFIDALARHRGDQGASLDQVLSEQVAGLGAHERAVLTVAAVAGRAFAEAVLLEAARVPPGEVQVIDTLRSARLLRATKGPAGLLVEMCHEPVARVILSGLSPASLADTHRAIALALERDPEADPDALFFHYREARDRRFAKYAVLTADRAQVQLAFDRAATLYRLALESRAEDFGHHEIYARLAGALAEAGRGAEAAQAFLDAAIRTSGERATEWRRRAVEQYLGSGHIDQGLAVLGTLLESVGHPPPKAPKEARRSRWLQNARLWQRGLRYRERDVSLAPPERVAEVDILYTAAAGLSLVDYARGAELQGRHLLLALRLGDPMRVLRAVVVEVAYVSALGDRSERRTAELVTAARSLADRLSTPEAHALALLAEGVGAHLGGDWARSLALLTETEALLTERRRARPLLGDGPRGVEPDEAPASAARSLGEYGAWELETARIFIHGALYQRGHLRQLAQRVEARVREADARGNVFASTELRVGHCNMVWLARDEPERAQREVDLAMGRWAQRTFYTQEYFAVLARANVSIYEGRPAEGLGLIRRQWGALEESHLLATEYVFIDAHSLLARASIAAALTDPHQGAALLATAEAATARIRDHKDPWAQAIAALLDASILRARGERRASELAAERAAQLLDRAGLLLLRLSLEAQAALAEGAPIPPALEVWAAAEGIADPARLTRTLVPGWTR